MARAPKGKGATPAKSTEQVGDTGLRRWAGYIDEEFLRDLRGVRGRKVYREMADNDPIVGAVLFAFTSLIRQIEWSVTPAAEGQAYQDAADFIHGVLFEDMAQPWTATIEEICTMFTYGFAPIEVVLKKRGGPSADPKLDSRFDDGRYGIRKMFLLAQSTVDSWEIDDDGEILAARQRTEAGHFADVPIARMLLFRTVATLNNPEGRSILRNAYRPWYYKRRMEEIEAIGVERDLAGYPVLKIPGRLMDENASTTDRSVFLQYKRLVTRIRRDQNEGVVLPSDRDENGNALYELTLLSTGGTRAFDTTKIIDAKAREIATSVLADFIFLGQKAVGSFALSSDKTEMFAAALGGFVDMICATINRYLIPRLWAINGDDPETMPKLTHGDIETPDLEKLMGFVSTMSAAGAALFPDRELENALRRMAGLPELPEDYDEDDPGAKAAQPGTGAEAAPQEPDEAEDKDEEA